MTTNEFKEYVKTRQALNTEEIHRFMDEMSSEARRITLRLNTAYYTPDEVRELLSELFGYQVPSSFRVFPPFYADFNHGLPPAERQTTYPAPIVLGKNVWVGSNSTILQGVTIGDNAVVGAGAVVTKDVEANTIVGGVPAKLIKRIE